MVSTDRQPAGLASNALPWQLIMVLVVALAFAALAWSSQRGLGMLWDEAVDLRIAAGYLDHPLYGVGDDGSQMRLPMMLNALAFAATGPSLPVSRGISIAVGVATLFATFGLCRRLFGGPTAVLACALLGFSPYFLAFARIAMTEGDVFPALFVTLACWSYVFYTDKRNGPRLALMASAIALAIGAKSYAAFLIPLLGLCELLDTGRRARAGETTTEPAQVTGQATSRMLLVAGLVALLLAMLTVALAQVRMIFASIVTWAFLLTLTAGIVVALLRLRAWRPTTVGGWLLMSVLALAITCAVMPQHVIHPDIVRTLARRALGWDQTVPGSLWIDHARLYAGLLLIGPTVPVGIAVAVSIVWAWIRQGNDPRLRVPLFSLTFFVVILMVLPLRQTFYLMTVWPMLCILTAAAVVAAQRRLAQRWPVLATPALVVAASLAAQQIVTSVHAHPDYNLYPRRWVGVRWLGAEARGYRNLVQTPCDGYAELIDWCMRNVQPGGRVVSYLWADHVLDTLLPDDLPFTLVRRGVYDAADRGLPPPDPPDIDQADYILLHINNQVQYGDVPPPDVFAERFNPEPVFRVRRDGDFTMAMVYGRRSDESSVGTTTTRSVHRTPTTGSTSSVPAP